MATMLAYWGLIATDNLQPKEPEVEDVALYSTTYR